MIAFVQKQAKKPVRESLAVVAVKFEDGGELLSPAISTEFAFYSKQPIESLTDLDLQVDYNSSVSLT